MILKLSIELDGFVHGCPHLLARMAGLSDAEWTEGIKLLSTKYSEEVTVRQESANLLYVKNMVNMKKSLSEIRNDYKVRQARWRDKNKELVRRVNVQTPEKGEEL